MAALILLLSLVFGYALLRLIPFRLYRAEAMALAGILGLFLGGWLLWLPALLWSYAVALPLAVTVMAVASFLLFYLMPASSEKELLSGRAERLIWLLSTGAFSLLLIYMFFTHMLPVGPGGRYTNGGAWGDMALHLTLLNSFAIHDHFDFTFSLISEGKLTYPFLVDFYSSVLYRTGWTIQASFLVPGLVLALGLVQLLFFLSLRLFGKAGAAALTLLIFLVNGSLAGIYYAVEDFSASRQSLWQFITHLPRDYTNYNEYNLHFTNFVTTMLIPQRSILLGAGVFLVVVLLFWQASQVEKPARPLVLAAILTGLLPFAHVHTFLVLGLLLLLLAAYYSYRQKTLRNWWVGAGLLALLIAAPQVWWQASGSLHQNFMHFYLGWMRHSEENLFSFWWRNFGFGLIGFLLLMPLWRRFNLFTRLLYLVAALLFILVNMCILQPFDYDNMKIIFYWYLFFSLLGGYVLYKGWQKGVVAKIGVTLFLTSLISPGILALLKENQNTYILETNQDIAFAADMQQLLPTDAVVLAGSSHNHPIPALTGRQVVLGYEGWLWTYGIDYGQIQQEVREMYAGTAQAAALLKKYQVSYVVIGSEERETLEANEGYFNQRYQTVYQSDDWRVYKIN